MDVYQGGFQKSELIELAEKIHKYKGEKQQLELELSSEEFHQRYIPQREKIVGGRIMANLPVIIFLTLMIIVSVVIMVFYIFNIDETRDAGAMGGMSFLVAAFILVFGGYFGFKLARQETEMLIRFYHSINPERAMKFAKKYDIKTFQDDKIRCERKISLLKTQINELDEKINELENRENELTNEAKRKEDVLKKYGVIKDELPEKEEFTGKLSFKLKEPEIGGGDIVELFDFYAKEESFVNYVMEDLRIKISNVDKEIVMIDSDFEKMKKRVMIFIGVLVIAALIQNSFSGMLANVTAMLCFIVGLFAALSLERFCFAPLVRYLVEHEHPIMAEYSFCNNIVPARRRKEELVERLRQQEDTLKEISEKKKTLELS